MCSHFYASSQILLPVVTLGWKEALASPEGLAVFFSACLRSPPKGNSCVQRTSADRNLAAFHALSFLVALSSLSLVRFIRQSTLFCGLANKNKTQNARRRVWKGVNMYVCVCVCSILSRPGGGQFLCWPWSHSGLLFRCCFGALLFFERFFRGQQFLFHLLFLSRNQLEPANLWLLLAITNLD